MKCLRTQKTAIFFRIPFRHIPELQKHHCKTVYSFSLEHDRRVLPMSEAHPLVNIFICQVHAPGKRGMTIDHADLPVIAVILVTRESRTHRRKNLALDTFLLHRFLIAVGQREEISHAVIHKPDFHALTSLRL